MERELIHKIFSAGHGDFDKLALEVFRFQYQHNSIYRRFADALHVKAAEVNSIAEIPFLPIGFFKSHVVTATHFDPETIFESSGTTGTVNSRHFVKEKTIYHKSFLSGFELFYGNPGEWCIIGLLPSYLERSNSSLTAMVNGLIELSASSESGFYLYDHKKLFDVLQHLEARRQKTLLIGVTFGLLDFAEKYSMNLEHTVVMETGGMKGRREEITRQEVHDYLKERLGKSQVHSEYGMTELLSQAYSKKDGLFYCPPWMRVMVRGEDDPLQISESMSSVGDKGVSGVINVIDLANVYSCSFIATDDAGKLYPDGSFEVLGRMDNSDIRGCSLMVV